MIRKSLRVVSLVVSVGRFQVFFFIPKVHEEREREGGNTHHPCVCLVSAPNVLGADLSGCPFIGLISEEAQGMRCRRRRFAEHYFRCPCAESLDHDQPHFSELCMILMAAIEIRHDAILHLGWSGVRHAGEVQILR